MMFPPSLFIFSTMEHGENNSAWFYVTLSMSRQRGTHRQGIGGPENTQTKKTSNMNTLATICIITFLLNSLVVAQNCIMFGTNSNTFEWTLTATSIKGTVTYMNAANGYGSIGIYTWYLNVFWIRPTRWTILVFPMPYKVSCLPAIACWNQQAQRIGISTVLEPVMPSTCSLPLTIAPLPQ